MDFEDTFLPPEPGFSRPECRISGTQVPYEEAVSFMEARVKAIRDGAENELLWFLEHPPLYTAGTSAKAEDLLHHDRFPVYQAGRGGEYTYHGPGQRVVYLMLDLKKRGEDIRCFVRNVENWMISTLAEFNIQAKISDGRVGVWVPRPELGAGREDKIGAIGIRVRRWVSFHGLALNVEPDLSHFGGIVPCGITDQGVTSLIDLGFPVSMEDVDAALLKTFNRAFEPCDA
ncbi:MAG: lipoyl(octanoyl) transferase LipB [Parvibaculales bacterium]